jgi:AbiV family abortive infection protein
MLNAPCMRLTLQREVNGESDLRDLTTDLMRHGATAYAAERGQTRRWRRHLHHLDTSTLKCGACYAVAHAVHLIEDAAILFSRGRISSSFHLAVLAREELGRANLLWEESRIAQGGQITDLSALRKKLLDHVAKLDAGQSTTQVQLPPEMVEAWTSAIERNDLGALRALHKRRRILVAEVRSKDPRRLHGQRLRAQYVDLNSDGTWSRPSQTQKSDAQSLILIVACELSGFLWLEPDDEFALALAQSGEALPTDAEFQERVIGPVLAGDA